VKRKLNQLNPADHPSDSDQQSPLQPGRRTLLKSAALITAGTLAGSAGLNAIAPAFVHSRHRFDLNTSHWSKALPAASPPLATDLTADIVIIGGGFTGLSAAYYLRSAYPDKNVILLEAARCGNGASGRNGAMLLTMTGDRYLRLSDNPEVDQKIYRLTSDNIRTLKALSLELGIDCEIEQLGALQVMNSAKAAGSAKEFAKMARELGFPYEYWSREKTASVIGTDVYYGALFDPMSGQVHPGKLVGLWKTAAEKAGVKIFDGTPVVNIEEGKIHTLTTSSGHVVKAAALVLATNAYTSDLGYLNNTIAPVYDYVGITPVLSEATLKQVGWTPGISFNDSQLEVYYAGLTADRRIHIGGGPIDYTFNNSQDPSANAGQRYAALQKELGRLYPVLKDIGFETTWCGLVDMSMDESPAVGQMGQYNNIFYGIGFSGHGVNLTSVFGKIIADLVGGKREKWAWLPYLDQLPPYIPNEPLRWLAVHSVVSVARSTGL